MKLHRSIVGFVLNASFACLATAQSNPATTKLPGQVVRVEAGEFFFRAPDTISAGLTTFVLAQTGDLLTNRNKAIAENLAPASATNDPTRAFHMLWLVRLDSGHTVNEWYNAELRDEHPSWATILGGPASAEPPRTTNATMGLTPGNYVLVCFIGSARADKTRYHLRKGMFKPLTVRPSSAPSATMPAGDMKVVIAGTGQIKPDGTLRKGTQSIRVENTSDKSQEFSVIRIKPGRTASEALTWRRSSGTDHPFEAVGGLSDVPPRSTLVTTVSLEPGAYLLWTRRTPETSVAFTVFD